MTEKHHINLDNPKITSNYPPMDIFVRQFKTDNNEFQYENGSIEYRIRIAVAGWDKNNIDFLHETYPKNRIIIKTIVYDFPRSVDVQTNSTSTWFQVSEHRGISKRDFEITIDMDPLVKIRYEPTINNGIMNFSLWKRPQETDVVKKIDIK